MKKGFTLIELLAVIVIIGILTIIAIPNITNVIENSKKSTYEEQVKIIRDAARTYMGGARSAYLPADGTDCVVTLQKLKNCGLLQGSIKNPEKKDEEMNGFVIVNSVVTEKDGQKVYKYEYKYCKDDYKTCTTTGNTTPTNCDKTNNNNCI